MPAYIVFPHRPHHRRQSRHRRGHGQARGRARLRGCHHLPANAPRPPTRSSHEIESARRHGAGVQADVSVEADVLRVFGEVDARLGTLTALVNNAGVLERQMRLDEMDVARWTRVLTTNVVGSFLCAREAVRRMSTRHGGRGGAIVNLSSMASVLGGANEYIDYAASKGAVDSMTVGLAREIATEGVRVNCVRPGPDPHRDPRQWRRARTRRSRQDGDPDAARRRARGGGEPRSCGCCRTRPATSPARSSTSAGDGYWREACCRDASSRPEADRRMPKAGRDDRPSEEHPRAEVEAARGGGGGRLQVVRRGHHAGVAREVGLVEDVPRLGVELDAARARLRPAGAATVATGDPPPTNSGAIRGAG